MTGPEAYADAEKQPASPDPRAGDPDPRVPDEWMGPTVFLSAEDVEAIRKGYGSDWPAEDQPDRPVVSGRLLGLLVAISAALVAGLLGFAAGRLSAAAPGLAAPAITAWQPIEAPQDSHAVDRVAGITPPSGASQAPSTNRNGPASVEPSPDPNTSGDIITALESGIASFMAPSYGSRYLALPEGRGVTVTICHGSRCVTRTSTDAGPDKAMQRAGRVADLSWADFKRLCDCDPYVVGLLRVTVERGGSPRVTPPATDR